MPSNQWPPQMMAGDMHDLIGWKRWVTKEDAVLRTPSAHSLTVKPLLEHTMSTYGLSPDPTWKESSSHQRGRPRHDWARYAGDPIAGYDPVVGYNMRWSSRERMRSRQVPFTSTHRSQSASNLELSAALQPLRIKPVVRRPPRELPPRPDPALYRVTSLEELAPEIEERRARKATEVNMQDSSQMATFLSAHASM